MATLELRPLPTISPTLAELMRVCHLRAALARSTGASQFVLGTPKAWLGTAYHFVLERIAYLNSHEDVQQCVAHLWNEAIVIQEQRASSHPLDKRFGKSETWPGYYLVRASVELRAREVALPLSSKITSRGAKQLASAQVSLEEEFTAFSGKLVGRPDVVRGDEIQDYKSGAITEFSEETQKEVVKTAYVRQLRIYGFLVKEKLGAYPGRGLLIPLGGAAVEVELQPTDCEREATEAVALLDNHNSKLRRSTTASELASPSAQGCKWCSFKSICPKFWESLSASWSGQLDGEAIEGNLINDPTLIHEGSAIALSVAVTRGTRDHPSAMRIAPLSLKVHAYAANLHTGDAIRITGLAGRMDGTVTPTQRTVVTRLQDIPSVALHISD